MYVEMDLTETSTAEEIYELSRTTEIALNSKNTTQKIAAIEMTNDGRWEALQKEVKELRRTAGGGGGEQVAAINARNVKEKDRGYQICNKPMSQRGPMLCWKCRQWGKHIKEECKLSPAEITRLTPQSKEERPTGDVHDAQFPNA